MNYLPVDLDTRRPFVTERMDITEIGYPADSFDVIFCSHVLEHIPDDRKAMRELCRVLKPGGWALFMVPLKEGNTEEDPNCTDPRERERRFGQWDHVRIYGMDLVQRLEEAGNTVTVIAGPSLAETKQDADRMGIWGKAFLCSK
jgi:SAM-dependent methyltransferase